MIHGRCLWCDAPPKSGSAWCEEHAGRWTPGHRGHPPERIRALRRRVIEVLSRPVLLHLSWWMRRARGRYGLPQ